jgi:hypothetical protein
MKESRYSTFLRQKKEIKLNPLDVNQNQVILAVNIYKMLFMRDKK